MRRTVSKVDAGRGGTISGGIYWQRTCIESLALTHAAITFLYVESSASAPHSFTFPSTPATCMFRTRGRRHQQGGRYDDTDRVGAPAIYYRTW